MHWKFRPISRLSLATLRDNGFRNEYERSGIFVDYLSGPELLAADIEGEQGVADT